MELLETILITAVIIAAAIWTSWSFYHITTHVISHRPSSAEKQKDIQRQNREAFRKKMSKGNVILEVPEEILGQKITTRELP